MEAKTAPPRPGYPIWSSGAGARAIGMVVSGTQSPSLGLGIGLGYVPPEFAKSWNCHRDRDSQAVVFSLASFQPNHLYRPKPV